MSLSNGLRLISATTLIALAATLTGCGYRPIYAHSSPTAVEGTVAELGAIEIDTIRDRAGQMMRTELKRRLVLRPGAKPLYSLKVTLHESIAQLAINRASFATRANLTIVANYNLIDNATGRTLTGGSLSSMSSYNILSSFYATHAAQDDSRKRTVEVLADDLRTRLSIYFNGPHKEPGKPTS